MLLSVYWYQNVVSIAAVIMSSYTMHTTRIFEHINIFNIIYIVLNVVDNDITAIIIIMMTMTMMYYIL